MVCVVVALLSRLVVSLLFPTNSHLEAYQRWADRDHLVVQVWLPATQAIVWSVAKLGGGLVALRAVFVVLGAAVVGLGALLVQRIGGLRAGWFFLPLAVFGPLVCWSMVPFRESTLVFVVCGALLLWRRAPLAADLVMGGLALVRHEGWPLLVVYRALRGEWRAVACRWGVAGWLAAQSAGVIDPFAASPDSFADWFGAAEHIRWGHAGKLLWDVCGRMAESAAPLLAVPAAVYFRDVWRDADRRMPPEATILLWAVAGQCVAVVGWVVALDQAHRRMMLLAGVMMGLVGAAGLAASHQRLSRRRPVALLVAVAILILHSLRDRLIESKRYLDWVGCELDLISRLQACADEVWGVLLRPQPGPRRRHDGCELIQGVTDWRAGTDFACLSWGQSSPEPTLVVRWSREGRRYRVERVSGTSPARCLW